MKQYIKPINEACPDIKMPEPKISKLVIFLIRLLVKPYLFMLFGNAKIKLHNDAVLFDSFRRALSKKSRCILAFRHPDGREPQLLLSFIMFKLKSMALRRKVKFDRKPHAIFVYGYEVARWGGWVARFFMPNVGAIPIHHTKVDSKGMARIQNAIKDGPYPVALAPEGQVSYSFDTVPRLETGIIRIGFQAATQLAHQADADEKNVTAPLEILPVSFHYRYAPNCKNKMNKLLKKTEIVCGFSIKETKNTDFYERIKKCRDYILNMNETRFSIKTDDNIPFEDRLKTVVNAALEKAERKLCIKAEGDFFQRLYKVRHHCWDKLFLPDAKHLNDFSYLELNIKNMEAGEAWHISRYQELADFGWYFTHPLPNADTPLHLTVEYVQNLWDFANRTMGGAISQRINIPVKEIVISTAEPINLSDKLEQYKTERKSTIEEVTRKLEKAFLELV